MKTLEKTTLVERLREDWQKTEFKSPIMNEAANRIEELEEKLRTATLELTNALSYVDKVVNTKTIEITYETMQRSGFKRKDGWARKYTLADARSDAKCAALGLRRAWDILDPPIKPF